MRMFSTTCQLSQYPDEKPMLALSILNLTKLAGQSGLSTICLCARKGDIPTDILALLRVLGGGEFGEDMTAHQGPIQISE